MEAIDDGSLNIFGLAAQRLDECECIKWPVGLHQYFASRRGPCVTQQTRRANHDSGGPRLCTTARAVR